MPPRNLHIIIVACLIATICFSTAQRVRKAVVIGDAIELIERYYVDPVESAALVEAAMTGMTSELDQHSEFIPADLYSSFNDMLHQEFAGVGILVEQPEADQPVRVITPLVGSPALTAGVMPGDEILKVAGQDVSRLPIREVSNRLRGPAGSEVVITVRREVEGVPQEREIRLRRETISLESVVGAYRGEDNQWQFRLREHPQVAYIRITSFGDKTAGELRQVLTDLDNDFEALILDVRANAGGLLLSAVEVCDDFLEGGRIVTIKKRGGEVDNEFDATPGTLVDPQIPMTVLIDGNSASASEIVAACLQDHGRATIVGSRSFGKGTVQNLLPLEFGRSALKLTTARYYRPNGRNIHRIDNAPEEEEWGVVPDQGFDVRISEEGYRKLVQHWQQVSYPISSNKDVEEETLDPQLQAAIELLLDAADQK